MYFYLLRVVAICLLLSGLAPTAYAAPAEEIRILVEQGRAADAYRLGAEHQELLGQPDFDLAFGVAAVDSGHSGEGILALERYIVNVPDNMTARLELARAYFSLGEDIRAREEFERVTKSNPPPAVQANIDRFLDAIRSRQSAYTTTGGVYVEAGYGYDSNVNGGVSSANINLPLFGNVVINQSGVKAGSSYNWLAAGGQVSKPILVPGLSIFGSGQLDGKYNNSNNQFDQNNVNAAAGLSYLRNKNFYRATFSHNEVSVDDTRFREVDSAGLEWNRQLSDRQTISPFIQYAELRYVGDNRLRDADLLAGGIGYRVSFGGNWQPLLSASVNGGTEHNIRDRQDLGREIYGGRVALAITPAAKWGVSTGVSFQHSHYTGPDLLLGETRKDNYYAVDATVSYAITRNLSARVELTGSKNSSNFDLYAYRRDMAILKLRYDFK
jgi:hypothetical protein